MESYKCPKCGNTKRFYRDVSIMAKMKVDNTDDVDEEIYDIDKEQLDNIFGIVYCADCGEAVFYGAFTDTEESEE